jgi:hypothetical protein
LGGGDVISRVLLGTADVLNTRNFSANTGLNSAIKIGTCLLKNIFINSKEPPSSASCSSCSAIALLKPKTSSVTNSIKLSISFTVKSSGIISGLASRVSMLKIKQVERHQETDDPCSKPQLCSNESHFYSIHYKFRF